MVLLLSCVGLKSLQAESSTNEISKTDHFLDTWLIAWEFLPDPYVNYKGHLCFKKKDIVRARLAIFDYMFMPHPYNSLYNDDMLETQAILDEEKEKVRTANNNLKISKQKNGTAFFGGVATGAVLTAVAILIFSK